MAGKKMRQELIPPSKAPNTSRQRLNGKRRIREVEDRSRKSINQFSTTNTSRYMTGIPSPPVSSILLL